jgi:hypothetical protein
MRTRERTTCVFLCLVVCWAFFALPSAFAADAFQPQPRRIAIAPFAVIGQDDVRPVAALLPRLLASRLMALAGVDAPVLPASDKPAAEAAREADAPLLLQGTVARLGKGYSIDIAASDTASGKSAGAFFAAAATEDDIIPQIGRLSEEISEKLFGVKPAYRPAPAAAATPAAPMALRATPGASVAPASGPAQAPVAVALAADWVPAAINKVSQSDKIPDELFGIVAISAEPNGDGEVVAWGKSTLYFYRVKGTALVPWTRITRELNHHFLKVDAVDLDGDGTDEILVTDRVGERIESFVLKRRGDSYEEAAEKIPYYLTVLADRKGNRVAAGQRAGVDTPFQGKFVTMNWTGGKDLSEGEPLPVASGVLPMSSGGILGLSAAKIGDADRFLYAEEAGYVRVLDEAGKTVFKGKSKFGWPGEAFEWGPYNQMEGKRAQVTVREAPRVLRWKAGAPMLLAVQMKNPGILSRIAGNEIEGSRVTLFQWEDSEFVERAVSKYTDYQITGADLVSATGLQRGAKVVGSVIEQPSGLFKDRVSRLLLLSVE